MKLNSEIKVIEAAMLAISATEREEAIRLPMEAYGFNHERIVQGKSLLDKVTNCQQQQMDIYDAQWSLSQQLNARLEAVQALFKEHANVARAAFRKDPNSLHALKIDRFAAQGWPCVRQAAYFYDYIISHGLLLQHFGIDDQELQEAAASVSELLAMKAERTRRKGLAEQSTHQKQRAMQELRNWVAEFRGIARIAFKANPQMLEAFGMPVLARD